MLRDGAASGDRPIMAVARPTDLSDPELRYWTKDPLNPVAFSGRPTSDLGQLWKNGARWNGLSNGRMFSTNDSSLHTWFPQPAARGFPGGGSGGQWFQPMPGTVDGQPAPPGSPTHLISTGNGAVYSSGFYTPENESFRVARENLRLDEGQKDGRDTYTWAALQCSGTPARCLTTAWISPAVSGPPGAPKAPADALSLVREVFFEPATGGLIVLPMSELRLLRNDTLFAKSSVSLTSVSRTIIARGLGCILPRVPAMIVR